MSAVTDHFRTVFGEEPEDVWESPGRVNLIGEHTDYNGGLVLPIALPQRTYAAARRRADGILRLSSTAGRRLGDDVLGLLTQGGQRGARVVVGQQPEAEQVAGGSGDSAFEGGRAREACPDRYGRVDRDVQASYEVARLAQRPQHARGVPSPAIRHPGRDVVEGDLGDAATGGRAEPQDPVGAATRGSVRALRQCDRQHEAAVVVGVLADEVHPTRRLPDTLGLLAEDGAEVVDDSAHGCPFGLLISRHCTARCSGTSAPTRFALSMPQNAPKPARLVDCPRANRVTTRVEP